MYGKAKISGNKMLMLRSGQLFVGIKDGNILDVCTEEESYELENKELLLSYINDNK